MRPPGRRLAILDTHLPWGISGFRDCEFRELARSRPDLLGFTLQRTTEAFPRPVRLLADFPEVAVASGITDVYLVFLNFTCGVLGLHSRAVAAGVLGGRGDISLAPELERHGIRVHATLHPGGGLLPDTAAELLLAVRDRTDTLFSHDRHVLRTVPDAVEVPVPIDTELFAPPAAGRRDSGPIRLVFAGDDRPRKGLESLLVAYDDIGKGTDADEFHLDVVGPQEHHRDKLRNDRVTWHGWLQPQQLADIFRCADAIIAPATRDLPEDNAGDTGMVDGFPSTAVRSAMATGCLLVGGNPEADHRIVAPTRDYVEIPERDPAALASALIALLDDRGHWREVAQRGADSVRRVCDARAVVTQKLDAMGC